MAKYHILEFGLEGDKAGKPKYGQLQAGPGQLISMLMPLKGIRVLCLTVMAVYKAT